ncbi:hypothetical protein TD95_004573 [Thielaviopsis punctulata]|uniref:CNH domain-containing protein n=1 Tax=Thielaviopsis punctulata TaxID=72032 RepID=A0A0F4Z8Q3_9PEZI|nr:hypothetical protein TD95_004573 [Thielaviopsis punctulata]
MSADEAQVEKPLPAAAALAAKEDGPFVLRTLLDNVPLASDAMPEGVKINCVEFYDGNLYIGTSASQLLHFVQIPADPADPSSVPSFIMASRLEPDFTESANSVPGSRPGVQQILLLPKVGKACILCNWTLTFYMLPEFSRAMSTVQVKNCNWVGGLDLNEGRDLDDHGYDGKQGVTIMLCTNKRIQVVRITEEARLIRNIDFAASTMFVRRDSIACVADSRSYALLDIDHQLKIPLMPIFSLDDSVSSSDMGRSQTISSSSGNAGEGLVRSNSSAHKKPPTPSNSHSRSTSLGAFISSKSQSQSQSADEATAPPTPTKSPEPDAALQLPHSESMPAVESLQRSTTPASTAAAERQQQTGFLKGHIVSPTKEEFLLVIGTSPIDPGIGMFVSLDGDPTRPTIEFDRYPKQVVIDNGQAPENLKQSMSPLHVEEEAYVIASMSRDFGDGPHHGLEIQKTDAGSQAVPEKHWLEPPIAHDAHSAVGIRVLVDGSQIRFSEIIEKLGQKRFIPFAQRKKKDTVFSLRNLEPRDRPPFEARSTEAPEPLPSDWEEKRLRDERDFVGRLASGASNIAVWAGNHIWWAVRNPLLLQLETELHLNMAYDSNMKPMASKKADEQAAFTLLESFKNRDARSELEFLTYNYLRQRAGLLLLCELMDPLRDEDRQFSEAQIKSLEEILVDSGLDPRVVLALIPGVRNEIIESRMGIWVFGGVKEAADAYLSHSPVITDGGKPVPAIDTLSAELLHFLRLFLVAWRRRKGFGSVAGEKEVFQTVDAALLLVLLEIDQHSPVGLAKSSRSPRAELYEVVDKGIDCFDRAVDMLEAYNRLFVLSRLYQSRKMAGEVLATWKRIIEGELDEGGELMDGEQRVRDYLSKVGNLELVREYGLWLANRNPKLGVEVFAEEKKAKNGLVGPRFDPTEVVAMLKAKAPGAVKAYLEHMVFTKGHSLYINDLISYFLDSVMDHLQASSENRDALAATYTAYRALQLPKPSYGRFLADNLGDAEDSGNEAWRNRLRLLQLLSSAKGYDASAIHARISALPGDLLVPETIILAAKAKQHAEALRLLVQSLGDYDTAVAYCLRGGRSIYSSASRYSALQQTLMSPTVPNVPSTADDDDNEGGNAQFDSRESLFAQQQMLFMLLLDSFLRLDDEAQRRQQTANLLERFGPWFELKPVLERVPPEWPLAPLGEFLVGALRRLVRERHLVVVQKALCSVQTLKASEALVVLRAELGPMVEDEEEDEV